MAVAVPALLRPRTRRRAGAGAAWRLSALLLAVLVVLGAQAVGATEIGSADDDEAVLLTLLNAERVAHGLSPLTPASDLVEVARSWSADLATTGVLAHNPQVATDVCCWQRVAENVGTARPPGGDAAERLHGRFLLSEGHLANMLHPYMDEVGIGAVVTEDALWVTVVFRAAATAQLASAEPTVARAGGRDRASTAVEISRRAFTSAETVLLAASDRYPDALAGAALSASLGAPILLAGPHALPSVTAEEIERLGATRAVLLGGSSALGWGVVHGLRQAGVRDFQRISGPDRFSTAAEIALQVGGDHVFLVEGANPDASRGWPDALSVSSLSAHTRRPILLVTRDGVPEATRHALARLGATHATVVGGTGAVGDAVLADLREAGLGVERVSGPTRYATSSALADLATAEGMSTSSVWLATGRDWPDALTAGPAAARQGNVLVLVDGHDPAGAPATHRWLAGRRGLVSAAWLVGGPSAITEDVARTILDDLAALGR